MKIQLFVITLFVSMIIGAQSRSEKTGAFVRVYDMQGKKMGKGRIFVITDSSLFVQKAKGSLTFHASEVGHIRTKRSAGNNVLLGAAIGGGLFAILGAASADPDAWIFAYSATEGAASGLLAGSLTGAAVGGITVLFKRPVVFPINGDQALWKTFKDRMSP